MAKKKPGVVPNRHIYSRISFLYQASAYLAQTGKHAPNTLTNGTVPAASVDADANVTNDSDRAQPEANLIQEDKTIVTTQNMSRKLLTDLRSITQKCLLRASPQVKRSICKYCDTLLIEGQTCTSVVENKSKGGKKPWADVLVIKCHTCRGEKRFPVHPREHKRRHLREVKGSTATEQQGTKPIKIQTAEKQPT